jgi:hypothetical protein
MCRLWINNGALKDTGRVRTRPRILQLVILAALGPAVVTFAREEHSDLFPSFADRRTDVDKLAGRAIRLRFEMKNAKLYAFEFR